MPSGYSSTTPTSVALDAGLVIRNTTLWGVTRGGIRTATGTEIRSIEFDGKRSARIVGLERVIGWDPRITFEALEFTTTNIPLMEPGATAVGSTWTPKRAGVLYADADYLTNFRVAWPMPTGTQHLQIRFPRALMLPYDGPNSEDKSEVGITLTVGAAQAVVSGDTDAPPYVVEIISGLGLA